MGHESGRIFAKAPDGRWLPESYRTAHWYNDIQHEMFVIILKEIMRLLREERDDTAATFFDMMTLYGYVHFLDEEEGMALSVLHGEADGDLVKEHMGFHRRILDWWREDIFIPYRSGTLRDEAALEKVGSFYDAIMQHIGATDQSTYGSDSGRVDRWNTREIFHIARSGLPLTPQMAGAYEVVDILDSDAAGFIDKTRIAPEALKAMAPLSLAEAPRFLTGRGGLRDVISDVAGVRRTPSYGGMRATA